MAFFDCPWIVLLFAYMSIISLGWIGIAKANSIQTRTAVHQIIKFKYHHQFNISHFTDKMFWLLWWRCASKTSFMNTIFMLISHWWEQNMLRLRLVANTMWPNCEIHLAIRNRIRGRKDIYVCIRLPYVWIGVFRFHLSMNESLIIPGARFFTTDLVFSAYLRIYFMLASACSCSLACNAAFSYAHLLYSWPISAVKWP